MNVRCPPCSTGRVKVLVWHVPIGGLVRRGGLLVEVECEKAVLEVTSWTAGVLVEKKAQSGQYLDSGTTLAVVEED